MWRVVLVGLLATGCNQVFGLDPGKLGSDAGGDGLDASTVCTNSDQCMDPSSPFCDVNNGGTCRPCQVHTECTSDACMPDGTCAAVDDVAFVMGGASGTTCTQASPCGTFMAAVKLLPTHHVLRASGSIDDHVVMDGTRTILADPGATLAPSDAGDLMTLSSGSHVDVYELNFTAQAGDAIRVANATLGLTHVHITGSAGMASRAIAMVGGSIQITRATIESNTGGGIDINASHFDITNSFIVKNGSPSAAAGGVTLQGGDATSRFEFNTVMDNATGESFHAGGVACNITAFVAGNNLIASNSNSAVTGQNQVFGACTYDNSLVIPDKSALNLVPGDYHLTSASKMAIDKGKLTNVRVDIDENPRPMVPNGIPDLGADEEQ
jgi:hypothetical protein